MSQFDLCLVKWLLNASLGHEALTGNKGCIFGLPVFLFLNVRVNWLGLYIIQYDSNVQYEMNHKLTIEIS